MLGKQSIEFEKKPCIISAGSVVGKKESQGPMGMLFDKVVYDDKAGADNWELAEARLQQMALEIALEKVFDYGCDNSNFHYFFISPGSFSGRVAAEIHSKTNFHHIQWT